jgi:hypothetical protein
MTAATEEEEPKPEALVQKKGNAIVTTKNKPVPSINTKPASPSKQTSSFYGRAKEASSSKVPSLWLVNFFTNDRSWFLKFFTNGFRSSFLFWFWSFINLFRSFSCSQIF